MAEQSFDVDACERRSREGHCFVCLIGAGDASQRAENAVIYEDDNVLVFLDRYPTVEGYVLVCPRRHVEHVTGDVSEMSTWRYNAGCIALARRSDARFQPNACTS